MQLKADRVHVEIVVAPERADRVGVRPGENTARRIESHRATLAWLPNFAFHHLAASRGNRRYDLTSVRALINCSEPCKPETFALFLERFAAMGIGADSLQCCYAMAENVFAVSQSRLGQPARIDHVDQVGLRVIRSRGPRSAATRRCRAFYHVGACCPTRGYASSGLRAKICPNATSARSWSPATACSTIISTSPTLPRGGSRTAGCHTNDLGYLADEEIFVIGRRDDLIISTGRNFFAHEIERVVNEVDGVVPGRCVALGIYSPAVGSQDIVVLAESDAADTPESGTVASRIRAAVSGAFGIALHATRLCRRGTLIKTSSGKISRSENLRLYVEQEAREVE